MTAWWMGLDLLHQVFYLIAIPFTAILILQTVLLLIGLGHSGDSDIDTDHDFDHDFDHDLDHDLDHDFDHDYDHALDHDVNHGFGDDAGHDHIGARHSQGLRMLSLRGIVAFMAVSGWTGISLLDLGAAPGLAVAGAAAAGFLAMLLVAWFMKMMTKLQQDGAIDLQNAVGLTGEVYIPITPEQKGKITLLLQERLCELDAAGDEPMKTGQRVKVIRVTDDHTAVVQPIN